MNAVVKGSLALVLGVALLTILIAVSGLHENAILGGLVHLVFAIGMNIAVIFWVLKQTASKNGYGEQLLNGVLIGVIAGVLILGVSWTLLTFVFPDFLDQQKEATISMLEAAGLPGDQLEKQVTKMEASTPASQAFAGLVGTFFTSTVVAAIAGIFLRKR